MDEFEIWKNNSISSIHSSYLDKKNTNHVDSSKSFLKYQSRDKNSKNEGSKSKSQN